MKTPETTFGFVTVCAAALMISACAGDGTSPTVQDPGAGPETESPAAGNDTLGGNDPIGGGADTGIAGGSADEGIDVTEEPGAGSQTAQSGQAGQSGQYPAFEEVDSDSDGEINRSELAAIEGLDFSSADTDQDGAVSRQEYMEATQQQDQGSSDALNQDSGSQSEQSLDPELDPSQEGLGVEEESSEDQQGQQL